MQRPAETILRRLSGSVLRYRSGIRRLLARRAGVVRPVTKAPPVFVYLRPDRTQAFVSRSTGGANTQRPLDQSAEQNRTASHTDGTRRLARESEVSTSLQQALHWIEAGEAAPTDDVDDERITRPATREDHTSPAAPRVLSAGQSWTAPAQADATAMPTIFVPGSLQELARAVRARHATTVEAQVGRTSGAAQMETVNAGRPNAGPGATNTETTERVTPRDTDVADPSGRDDEQPERDHTPTGHDRVLAERGVEFTDPDRASARRGDARAEQNHAGAQRDDERAEQNHAGTRREYTRTEQSHAGTRRDYDGGGQHIADTQHGEQQGGENRANTQHDKQRAEQNRVIAQPGDGLTRHASERARHDDGLAADAPGRDPLVGDPTGPRAKGFRESTRAHTSDTAGLATAHEPREPGAARGAHPRRSSGKRTQDDPRPEKNHSAGATSPPRESSSRPNAEPADDDSARDMPAAHDDNSHRAPDNDAHPSRDATTNYSNKERPNDPYATQPRTAPLDRRAARHFRTRSCR